MKNNEIKDYSLMSTDRQFNGINSDPVGIPVKKFESRYLDDGAWTRESFDEGYVEFEDYIKDRREGVDNGISFNGKQFKPSRVDYEDVLCTDIQNLCGLTLMNMETCQA